MTRFSRLAAYGFAGAAALLLARTASAQVMCDDTTTLPNPIILTGSSAFEATVEQFAVKLSAESTPTSIIYQVPGSCSGVANFAAPLTGTGDYYTLDTTVSPPKITVKNCTFGTNQMADVAISDVFYSSCTNVAQPIPSDTKDISGPVQAMLFIVNKGNPLQYITALEAADIFGCGYTAGIAGFNVNGGILCRDPNSGTQITVADNIGIPASAIVAPACTQANPNKTSGVIAGVEGFTAMPNAAIGFIGADAYDQNRAQLSSLAFQAYGQTYAYYSDSGPSTADRQNVRDGHYVVWGYEHMIVKVDSTGTPTNPKAANFVGWINGTKTDSSFDYINLEGTAGTIPLCAMKVQRSGDGGPLSPYTPSDTCGCAFEAAITHSTPSECVTCTGTGTSTCTGGKSCHHGYCE
jgi:ABC-type phosphate transport system substrate-binding protein